jgi:hypothetical protein
MFWACREIEVSIIEDAQVNSASLQDVLFEDVSQAGSALGVGYIVVMLSLGCLLGHFYGPPPINHSLYQESQSDFGPHQSKIINVTVPKI